MASKLPTLDARRADFGDLRDAYVLLSDIFQAGGMVVSSGRGLGVQRVPRLLAGDIRGRLKGREQAMVALVEGSGEKKSLSGATEVVLAVIGKDRKKDTGPAALSVCALEVRARGPIVNCLVTTTDTDGWDKALAGFVDWKTINGVICAAEGNNQRAAIGAVLAAAGIGRGNLRLIEMEAPQEIDESTHLVRGAEWMKAGLPRFLSAASEAIWCLLRARSLHSRMFREKKQGYYTSMAVLALWASGVQKDDIAARLSISESLIDKFLVSRPAPRWSKEELAFFQQEVFGQDEAVWNDDVRGAIDRIWKGPAIYLRGMRWRQSVSRQARTALYKGGDLVEVAQSLRVQRRELVRILSQTMESGELEGMRFLAAVPKPAAFEEIGKRSTE